MKFLNSSSLATINQILSALCSQRNKQTGRIECFQVEASDVNEYRSHSLERPPFQLSFGTSPDSLLRNPIYNIEAYSSSHHFPALKSAIETTFPDYDFSMLCPWHFKLIQSMEQAKMNLNWAITSYFSQGVDLSNQIWYSIDSEIQIGMCDIYEYQTDCPDPFSAMGTTFNFLYFFLNEKQNKVLVLHLQECSNDDEQFDDIDDFDQQYGYSIF
mgnify:FL=1